MRKLLMIGAVLLMLTVNSPAQDDLETISFESEKANLVDEFGKVGECDLGARLDGLFISLYNDPGAAGYIIFYKGKDELPAEYESKNTMERRIKNYVRFRRVDAERLTFLDGGFRENLATELWIVPKDAEPPIPSNTIPKPLIPNDQTIIYDRKGLGGYEGVMNEEFILDSVKAQREAEQLAYELENAAREIAEDAPVIEEPQQIIEEPEAEKPTAEEIEAEQFSWANEKFGEVIKNQKDARGVIVFYADEREYDIAKIQTHIEQGKQRIAKSAKIAPDKIQIIFGGYKSWVNAEFWIVPKNGKPPERQPEKRPIEQPETESNAETFQ